MGYESGMSLIDFILENLEQMYEYQILEDGFELERGSAIHLYGKLDGMYMASKMVVSVFPSFLDETVEIEIEDIR